MGSACSSQKQKQPYKEVAQSVEQQILVVNQPDNHQQAPVDQGFQNENFQDNQQYAPQEMDVVRERKYTKIDVAQDSIDLTKKKKQSIKDISAVAKQIEAAVRRYSVINERITFELKEPNKRASLRERIISQYQRDKSISMSRQDDNNYNDENTQTYTVYRNKSWDSKANRNNNGINLLSYNSHDIPQLYYQVVADIMYMDKHKELLESMLFNTSDTFLQNIQMTEKFVNSYGLFYILKEALLTEFNIQLILQNDYSLKQSKQITFNRLSLTITDLPAIIAFQGTIKFVLHFKQQPEVYANLKSNHIYLTKYLEDLRQLILQALQKNGLQHLTQVVFLMISIEQQQQFSLSFCIQNIEQKHIQLVIKLLQVHCQSQIKFTSCTHEKLIKYVSASLVDLDPWNSREFKEENMSNAETQIHSNSGWKLFAFKHPEQLMHDNGFVEISNFINYNQQVQIYSGNEIGGRLARGLSTIGLKVYGERRNYKLMLQIDCDMKNIYENQRAYYLKNFHQSRCLGLLLYDEEHRIVSNQQQARLSEI